jgi:hypothetical protein
MFPDCNDIAEATSYSVKLIPIVLNEKGETEENHFQTRGLPRLAARAVGLQILTKLQKLSEQFGTIITIEDTVENMEESPVIGWVQGAVTNRANPNATPDPTATPISSASLELETAPVSPPVESTGNPLIDSVVNPPSTRHRDRRLSSTAGSPPTQAGAEEQKWEQVAPLIRQLSPQASVLGVDELNVLVPLSLKLSDREHDDHGITVEF